MATSIIYIDLYNCHERLKHAIVVERLYYYRAQGRVVLFKCAEESLTPLSVIQVYQSGSIESHKLGLHHILFWFPISFHYDSGESVDRVVR